MERFRAYEGNESYAFISYAHMDSDRVYEIISALNNDGFRLWYDQGIEIARRYKAIINEHIEKCAAFVVFATRNGIKREEVIDECAYAIALRKKMIIVYLEDIPAEELDAALRATFTINYMRLWRSAAENSRISRQLLARGMVRLYRKWLRIERGKPKLRVHHLH